MHRLKFSEEVSLMIYCIEDDSAIRDLMVYTLQASGFEARGFESDAGFWPAMREQRPELVILDVMLPGEDGLTILRKLRSSPVTADIPVIMATAKDSEYDTVIGLDSGADDYLAKPFGMMEMVSRIRAVLRRSGSKQPMLLSHGIVAMDESKHTVTVNGKAVFLTLKEYELLKLFMENPGRVFTRDNILSIVWGVDYSFETRTVDVHIGTLRTKLENAGDYIQTIRGVG
jgi:two-component system alkaline phosphatase synthesis response regulator PhoP